MGNCCMKTVEEEAEPASYTTLNSPMLTPTFPPLAMLPEARITSYQSQSDERLPNTPTLPTTPTAPTTPTFSPTTPTRAGYVRMPHMRLRVAHDGAFHSPVADVLVRSTSRVLDVGCGGKIDWVLENARRYRYANFCGVDTTLAVSAREERPLNASFITCSNLPTSRLPFGRDTFEFVHVSGIGLAFQENELGRVIDELIRVLKPGGWIEISELDMEFRNEGQQTANLCNAFRNYVRLAGINPSIGPDIENLVNERNSTLGDVAVTHQSMAIGTYGGEHGTDLVEELKRAFTRMRSDIAGYLGVSDNEYADMIKTFARECNTQRTYARSTTVYARKKPYVN